MTTVSVIPKQQINIKLDLQQGWLNPKTIVLKQSDHLTRVFMIRVRNTLPINLTGYRPCLFVKRKDGEVLSVTGEMVDATQGEFMVKLNATMLKIEGEVVAEVVITQDGEEVLSFPHFSFVVEDSIHDEEQIDEEELGIVWELINQTKIALEAMGDNYDQFKEEKEFQFQASERQRNENEIIRQEGYAEMQDKVSEVYTTTLKYRIIE